jgi:hypothetical protein
MLPRSKSLTSLSLPLLALLIAPLPKASAQTDQLVPGGSTFTCRVSEGRISSKTMAIGDPVLCTLNPVEFYGRSVLPFGSYIEGRFVDYKDPGHFVGKGWMELRFDRMFLGNRVIPIDAKVVQVPKYKVDQQGRILGSGHAVKDTVTWLIPVLWPIDLINLPRRGPSPVLKPETLLTLEMMDDVGIPNREDRGDMPQQRQAGLIERNPQPQAPQQVIYQNFAAAPAPPQQQQQQVVIQQAAPQASYYQQPPAVIVRPRVYVAPPPPPNRYYYPPAY